MRYLLLALCLMLGACSGVEVLEPAHDMAVENQQNLDANIETLIKHFLEIARSHPAYEESDEEVLVDLTDTVREQAAISMAYIALIDAYISGREIDGKAFENLLRDLPRLIEDGVDLWEELQKLLGTTVEKRSALDTDTLLDLLVDWGEVKRLLEEHGRKTNKEE